MDASSGTGLIEALVAIMVVSIALFAVAGIGLSVWSLTTSAGRLTDRALLAQRFLEEATAAGYRAAGPTNVTVTEGSRAYAVTRSVSFGSRTVTVRVAVSIDPSDSWRPVETVLSIRRPWPRTP